MERNKKIFNDPIHGTIEVNSVCLAIIDTPEFQRLRNIKQLGGAYYVYPAACHNRFEHSIGVYYLAGQFVRILKDNQPDLPIDDKDILCVEIAALCHDLGHGPFSHVFERQLAREVDTEWKHERASKDMLKYIIQRHPKVRDEMERAKLTEADNTFIEEMIDPPKYNKEEGYPFKGRKECERKHFLYEIVSNHRNSIDVDKWDYYARDCYMLGMKNSFDHWRYMKLARVVDVKHEDVREGEIPGRQICMKDTEAHNIYTMFQVREYLHRRAYKHKDTIGVELMITDAFWKVNKHIKDLQMFGDSPPDTLFSCTNMENYSKLTDVLFHQILLKQLNMEPPLSESTRAFLDAQLILNKINSRQLYKCIGRCNIREQERPLEANAELRIKREIMENKRQLPIHGSDVIVHVNRFDYGMKEVTEDPLEHVRFYTKGNRETATRLPRSKVSQMLPDRFHQETVAVYCTDREDQAKCESAKTLFKNWCEKSENPIMDSPDILN